MSEIILSSRTISSKMLENHYGIDTGNLSSYQCLNIDTIIANQPYLLSSRPSIVDKTNLVRLSNPKIARDLTALSLSYGSDNVSGMAQAITPLLKENQAPIGAVASVYAGRMDGFVGSVKKYQAALLRYRDAMQSNPQSKVAARQQAKMAFDNMQNKFSHEIKVATRRVNSSRGQPLTRVDRGLNIARSSRNVTKLDITSQVQLNNIVKLSKYAKVLGNGIAVIDFGSRVNHVRNSYNAGSNWERDLFVESSSFATSATVGLLTIKGGLALLVFATPLGWAALIVGGVLVAGAAVGASVYTNSLIKNNAGNVYDVIMKELGYP